MKARLWAAAMLWTTALCATAAATCWRIITNNACNKAGLPGILEPCDFYEFTTNADCPSIAPASAGQDGYTTPAAPWTTTCSGWQLRPQGGTCVRNQWFSENVLCRTAKGLECVGPPAD